MTSKGERWKLERKCASTTNVAREASLAFLEADANGDGVLEYHEFVDAIRRLRTRQLGGDKIAAMQALEAEHETELRELFASIDTNKSGTIEMVTTQSCRPVTPPFAGLC